MNDTPYKSGWVALAGPTNAGKSTLLNSVMGQKIAIVTPKAQTTRNQISGILTQDDAQIIFLDTPGLHDTQGMMNKMLTASARQAITGVEAIILVLDAALYAKKPNVMEKELEQVRATFHTMEGPLIIAANKVDSIKDKSLLLPVMERLNKDFPNAEIFPVSALHGMGLGELVDAVKQHIPQGEQIYPEDQISTVPVRFMASEIIREKLFLRLRQELPYSVGVDIENWEEDAGRDLARISAVIYVSRKNHKSMVIGKKGIVLKEVGAEARKEIQELIDMRVYLELFVKVREGWIEDANFMRELGFTS